MALQALTSKPKVKIRIALPYPQSNTSSACLGYSYALLRLLVTLSY
jgi:hypothetical protein